MASGRTAFMFIDVDGFCVGGIDQRTLVTHSSEGFRARELAWAYYTPGEHASGSIYFHDEGLARLPANDQSVQYAARLHGLPVHPNEAAYAVRDPTAVLCSTELLAALRALHEGAAAALRAGVVFVHKGGNEGLWCAAAVPGVSTIDLCQYGCPKVETIAALLASAPPHCGCHATSKRKKLVHCPRLEIQLLAAWVIRAGSGAK